MQMRIRDPGIFFTLDPGIFLTLDPWWKKFGSGINFPDPQHWDLASQKYADPDPPQPFTGLLLKSPCLQDISCLWRRRPTAACSCSWTWWPAISRTPPDSIPKVTCRCSGFDGSVMNFPPGFGSGSFYFYRRFKEICGKKRNILYNLIILIPIWQHIFFDDHEMFR